MRPPAAGTASPSLQYHRRGESASINSTGGWDSGDGGGGGGGLNTTGPGIGRVFATEAEVRAAFQELPLRRRGDRHGGAAADTEALPSPLRRALVEDDSDEDFDITEDIFHPLQQIRLQRRRWAQEVSCTPRYLYEMIKRNVPALTWLPRYKPAKDLLPDVLTGVMLAVVSIPQGVAYAILAGVPPIIGLYGCIIPPLLYGFLGCSKHMHIGPFALTSLLVGQAIAQVAPPGASDLYIQDMAFLFSILSGLLLMGMSVLRLGFAVSFLSDSVLSAYTCASAFLIFASQWKSLLGMPMPSGMGFIDMHVYIVSHLGDINGAALLMGLGSSAALVALDMVNARWKPRVPIPSQLIVVILGTAIAAAGKMDERYGMQVVGFVPSGLPSLHVPGFGLDLSVQLPPNTTMPLLPDGSPAIRPVPELLSWKMLTECVQPVCMIALISYIISISIAKNFAVKEAERANKARKKREEDIALADAALAASGQALAVPVSDGAVAAAAAVEEEDEEIVIDANQELVALGLSNLISGFTQCYPSAGSLSRSALVYEAGVHTSFHNVISVSLLVLVLLALTPALYYLPFATLAAIVNVALKGLILQVYEAARLYHLRKTDFLMWAATFGATIVFDTQIGIAVGVLTSLLMLLKQTSRPPVATLGRLAHTDLYRSVRSFPLAKTYRNVLIFRFDAPLHFANKDYFKEQLVRACARAQRRDYAMALPEGHVVAQETQTSFAVELRQKWGEVRDISRQMVSAVEAKIKAGTKRLRRGKNKSGGGAGHKRGKSSHAIAHAHAHLHAGQVHAYGHAHGMGARRAAAAAGAGAAGEEHKGAQMEAEPDSARLSQSEADEPSVTLDDESIRLYEGANITAATHSPRPDGGDGTVAEAEDEEEDEEGDDGADGEGVDAEPAPVVVEPLTAFAIEWVVLDCSAIVDVDDSALSMLAGLPQQLGITLVFCALKAPVRDLLDRMGFFNAVNAATAASEAGDAAAAPASAPRPGVERPFVTVHQAVKHLRRTIEQQHEAHERQQQLQLLVDAPAEPSHQQHQQEAQVLQ